MSAIVNQTLDELAALFDLLVGKIRVRDDGIDPAGERIGTRESQAVPQIVMCGFRIPEAERDDVALSVMDVDDSIEGEIHQPRPIGRVSLDANLLALASPDSGDLAAVCCAMLADAAT
jgi:hypothetical protein